MYPGCIRILSAAGACVRACDCDCARWTWCEMVRLCWCSAHADGVTHGGATARRSSMDLVGGTTSDQSPLDLSVRTPSGARLSVEAEERTTALRCSAQWPLSPVSPFPCPPAPDSTSRNVSHRFMRRTLTPEGSHQRKPQP